MKNKMVHGGKFWLNRIKKNGAYSVFVVDLVFTDSVYLSLSWFCLVLGLCLKNGPCC